MRYAAIVRKEDGGWVAEFPDCPGCVTQADPPQKIEEQAQEALEGWLESTLLLGRVPPRPKARRAPRRTKVIWVQVPARLGAKLAVRWARTAAGLTQAELAAKAGLKATAIARLEHPDWNPTLETLEKVARALGAHLEVGIISDAKGAAE